MDEEEITLRFTYHPPVGGQAQRYVNIRERALHFALFLNAHCPESRELSRAMSHLEDVVFCANAAIARRTTDFET